MTKIFFPNITLASTKVVWQNQSEIHWAHSTINGEFLCLCSLSQWQFLNIFCIFVIPTYDIYNKFSKLNHFGHFYFWPLLASIRGCWKDFLLTLIQQWLVGRFKGPIKGLQPAWSESKIPNRFWVILLYSNFYLHLDFGLNRGWIEAGTNFFCLKLCTSF